MGAIQAVLFDIDGTLIDSNALHVVAWLEAFAGVGHPIEPQAIASRIGMGGDLLVPALLPDVDEEMQRHVAKRHGAIFKGNYLADARPFPGAHDLVAHAHERGLTVVLASSSSAEEVAHYADLLGITDLLAATTSIDDVGQSKPAPDIFATALKKIGVPAGAAIAIGDSPFDAEAAKTSGIATIGLLSGGFDRTVLIAAGMDAIYADAADLLARFDASPLAR